MFTITKEDYYTFQDEIQKVLDSQNLDYTNRELQLITARLMKQNLQQSKNIKLLNDYEVLKVAKELSIDKRD